MDILKIVIKIHHSSNFKQVTIDTDDNSIKECVRENDQTDVVVFCCFCRWNRSLILCFLFDYPTCIVISIIFFCHCLYFE